MKRILFILALLASCVAASWAQTPTTDRVYATALEYDEEVGLHYFDVYLEGENFYTGYGMDIQLPEGLEVALDGALPYVYILDDYYLDRDEVIYPKSGRNYTHSASARFPQKTDKSHVRVGCMSSRNQNFLKASGGLFRVYCDVTYQGGWPIGSIKIYDAELDHVGSYTNPANHATITPIHLGETSLDLSVSAAAHWSTCILPFTAEVPQGVIAYVCNNKDDNYLYLSSVGSLEAFTPYVLYSENGFSGTLTGNVESAVLEAKSSSGYLNGAILPQTVTEGYVMQMLYGEVKFYAIEAGKSFDFPAGKCWMNVPAASSRSLGIRTERPVGINGLENTAESTATYDVSGRRANASAKGIQIHDGKKALIY